MTAATGLTVYGCAPDEEVVFEQLSPRFGLRPTMTRAAVSVANAGSAAGNRCISVDHRSGICAPTLHALKDTGVELVCTRSIGVNHIDLDAAARLGITVENVAYAPDGVADYTLMLILMAVRNAKDIVICASTGDFRLRPVRGRELCDMTVGVVGVGNIGGAVITRLRGFGCRVLTWGNNREATSAVGSLDELLRASDVVTLHLPLNRDTHHIIGREQIQAMKPGAHLINTGRGALVDTDALITALEAGTLGGAALDVLEGEEGLFYFDCTNRSLGNRFVARLQALPNVIITPHTAYYTGRVLYDTVEQTLTKCLEFERGRTRGGARG